MQGPPVQGVRPTSDRLRETLFNLVDVETPGRRVLDGFAGTGANGLEALSRGAAHVTFVEQNPRAIAVIRRNVDACRATEACVIIRSDFIGLARQFRSQSPFDLVLLDPPYDYQDMDAALTESAQLLRAGGLVVLEHARRREVPAAVAGLELRRQVTAGDSQLAFYAWTAKSEPVNEVG